MLRIIFSKNYLNILFAQNIPFQRCEQCNISNCIPNRNLYSPHLGLETRIWESEDLNDACQEEDALKEAVACEEASAVTF